MKKREKTALIVILVIVLIIFVSYLFVNYGFMLYSKKVTLIGIVESSKMPIINGTLILDSRLVDYTGKRVEVVGYVYNHKCKGNEQCFNGPYMGKIVSIKVLD